MSDVKVGDTVSWENVPDGALVKTPVIIHRHKGICRMPFAGIVWVSPWRYSVAKMCTIIALGLSGQEAAADLQRLAEVYEVREAMLSWSADERAVVLAHEAAWGILSEVAERLHASGFRRGMTAEDAASLLAEVRDG
jgi:hypothetical protein